MGRICLPESNWPIQNNSYLIQAGFAASKQARFAALMQASFVASSKRDLPLWSKRDLLL